MDKRSIELGSKTLAAQVYSDFSLLHSRAIPATRRAPYLVQFQQRLPWEQRKALGNLWGYDSIENAYSAYEILEKRVRRTVAESYQVYYQEAEAEARLKLGPYGAKGQKVLEEMAQESNQFEQTTVKQIIGTLAAGMDLGQKPMQIKEALEERLMSRGQALGDFLESMRGQAELYRVLWEEESKGATKYRYIGQGEKRCADCAALDGKIFPIKDGQVGVNLPPLHPNCVCSIGILDDKGEIKVEVGVDGRVKSTNRMRVSGLLEKIGQVELGDNGNLTLLINGKQQELPYTVVNGEALVDRQAAVAAITGSLDDGNTEFDTLMNEMPSWVGASILATLSGGITLLTASSFVAGGIILIKAASGGAATEAFFGWVEAWDAYEAEHGLDGGIWEAALSGAKAKVAIGALEGIIFAPFAAWDKAMRLATKTDDMVQVIDKAEDILAGATKGSKGFSNLDEFDTLKGSKVVKTNASPSGMVDEILEERSGIGYYIGYYNDSNEMLRKKKSASIPEPMPKKQLQKIVERFERRGGVIQMDDATDAYLESKMAEAITLNENTILLRQNPSRSSVFEELIHSTQFRRGLNDGSLISRLKNEIEAQNMLLKNSKAYNLTLSEIKQTEAALASYMKELKDLLGGK